MRTKNQEFGRQGEQRAEQYLKKQGYLILDRHYTTRWGEIDLIAQDKEELVFIEVKSRKTRTFGLPEEAITEEKLNRLIKTIYCYLEENDLSERNHRIDVILILVSQDKKHSVIRHLKSIFYPQDSDSFLDLGEGA